MKRLTKSIVKGLTTWIPGTERMFCSSSGGTVSARYCYAVWLRHIQYVARFKNIQSIQTLGELGPGDSFGTGLAALLCGVDQYHAFDAKPHADVAVNIRILNELVQLFRDRAPVPDASEFPHMSPSLEDYAFPTAIISASLLKETLREKRIEEIREDIKRIYSRNPNKRIVYHAPWRGCDMPQGHFDMFLSQAALEHVSDVNETYRNLNAGLKVDGIMSHAVDYKSHGITEEWFGHWEMPNWLWRVVHGRRPYLINRMPHSYHVSALSQARFKVLTVRDKRGTSAVRSRLSSRFSEISNDDLTCTGAFIIAEPAGRK